MRRKKGGEEDKLDAASSRVTLVGTSTALTVLAGLAITTITSTGLAVLAAGQISALSDLSVSARSAGRAVTLTAWATWATVVLTATLRGILGGFFFFFFSVCALCVGLVSGRGRDGEAA